MIERILMILIDNAVALFLPERKKSGSKTWVTADQMWIRRPRTTVSALPRTTMNVSSRGFYRVDTARTPRDGRAWAWPLDRKESDHAPPWKPFTSIVKWVEEHASRWHFLRADVSPRALESQAGSLAPSAKIQVVRGTYRRWRIYLIADGSGWSPPSVC